jgi:hypothetical protein
MSRSVTLATKTLAAIDAAIEADQGAAYRQHLQRVLPHIADAYRGAEENPFRSHMGASIIGRECARAIWYGFHWTTIPNFPGRILRLFNRGHLEEGRVIAALLTIGVQVYQQDANGKQFRITHAGGHFGGSGDGVGVGIPDLPAGTPCLLEFKTHNDNSFKKLLKEGVRGAKFEHYVQMNQYMRKMEIPVALYGAVNKNDDALHLELVHLDSATADQFLDRGQQLVFMREAPKRISESPGWFACTFCDHKPVCHLKKAPARNCRTCAYSETGEDGHWYCRNTVGENIILDTAKQLAGCELYKVF